MSFKILLKYFSHQSQSRPGRNDPDSSRPVRGPCIKFLPERKSQVTGHEIESGNKQTIPQNFKCIWLLSILQTDTSVKYCTQITKNTMKCLFSSEITDFLPQNFPAIWHYIESLLVPPHMYVQH